MTMLLILLMLIGAILVLAGPVVIIIVVITSIRKNKKAVTVSSEEQQVHWEALPTIPLEAELLKQQQPQQQKILAHSAGINFFQGTAALIIGVLFVVLAGLIFATTTWQTLPNFSEVFLIFGFSGLFFIASWLAETVFKIKRTSQAFYILGSVFLFLTVLAAGYFELLGAGFSLTDEHYFKVLCIGGWAMELALIAGLRRFDGRIYRYVCLSVMSIGIFWFLKAWNLSSSDSIKGMVCYSALALFAGEFMKKRNGILITFTRAQFWVFCALMTNILFYEYMGIFLNILFYSGTGASVFSALTLGMMTAGTALLAVRQEKTAFRVLFSISAIIFFNYLSLCIDTDFIYQLLAGAIMTGMWFAAEKVKKLPVGCVAGECLYTLVIAADTFLIMLLALVCSTMTGYAAATGMMILFTAICVYWSRRFPVIRTWIPLILFPVTISVYGMTDLVEFLFWDYEIIVLLYLLASAAWDIKKRDRFCIAIVVIAALAQMFFEMIIGGPVVFALVLSGYLFIKSRYFEDGKKVRFEQGGCIALLVGIFYVAGSLLDHSMLQVICVTAVFIAEYVVFRGTKRDDSGKLFWEMTGILVLLQDMVVFYSDDSLAPVYLVVCLIIFALFYTMFYRNGCKWYLLIAAVMILPMPLLAAYRYNPTADQLYGFTAAALLLSGGLTRRFVPIITCAGEKLEDWKFDWFHILAVFILIPMMLCADSGWRCAYLILLALYILQYRIFTKYQNVVLTSASVFVLLAFWLQPFITYPELIDLEIQMAAAALFIWSLSFSWKGSKIVSELQRVLYCLCIAALLIDALVTASVVDALILEVVCLLIFVWANVKKDIIWLRISGTVIVAVALYMTKDFWLSLSWWIYLMAAGIGLIVFAALNEMKKK